MEKIVKSLSKNKFKEIDPQIYLKASKKESIEIKQNKILKRKLKFNEKNRHFGNDLTNSIKNNAQFNGFRSFHKKSTSVSDKVSKKNNYLFNFLIKVNKEGIKDNHVLEKNNSSVKNNIIEGRNNNKKNATKTFNEDNAKNKKDNNSIEKNNYNNIKTNNKNISIPKVPKLKKSVTNVNAKTISEKESNHAKNKKNRLIKISESKIEQGKQNQVDNKNLLNNNKDIINRLKNQNSSLKYAINSKNNYNNLKKVQKSFQLENKENFQVNKYLENEKSNFIINNLLGKHDTFGLNKRKNFLVDKNNFNKNSYFNKEKHNHSNNLIKNKIDELDILYQIKNLKSFHPSKFIINKSIKKSKEKFENTKNNENKEELNYIKNNSKEKANKEKDLKMNDKENIIKENENKENNKEDKNDKKDENNDKNNKKETEKLNPESKEQKEVDNINNEVNKEVSNKKNDLTTNENTITTKELVIYFDTTHINNVQVPKEYLNVIYYNLLVEESHELTPKLNHEYMNSQKEINDQMRGILVDWIIDVHYKFGFTDETLFMTILIIDRYCSSEKMFRSNYQCLGITALMIACKHEEINVPKVEDFIYITDNAYTKEEVFKMENDVLSKLNFELLYPSPIKFYEYLSLNFNFSKKYHMLGKYLMETFLLDLKWIKYTPSIISCACVYIVMKFFKLENYRQSYDKKFYLLDENINTIPSGYSVKDCAQDICVFVDNINNNNNLLSCQKKYSKKEFESVANLLNNN